jgi:molybdopterin-guanine dinucleotide biosynthesis protein A
MAVNMPVSAAILCGGEGRRMGGVDKSQLRASGRPFIDRQLDVLRALTPHLMLIDRDAGRPVPPGVRLVTDIVPASGALGGIYTALERAATDRVLVLACDMPFVTSAFLSYLIERDARADVVIPRDGQGRSPLCGVFHRRLAPAIRTRLDARTLRVEDALAAFAVTTVDARDVARFDTDGRLLLNVNTPAEYDNLMNRHQHGTFTA